MKSFYLSCFICPPRVTVPATTTTTPTMSPWKGDVPRVYELTCDDTVCPPDSFCLSDYDGGGGSRCHCNLGRSGDTCSDGERHAVLGGFPCKCNWLQLQVTLLKMEK